MHKLGLIVGDFNCREHFENFRIISKFDHDSELLKQNPFACMGIFLAVIFLSSFGCAKVCASYFLAAMDGTAKLAFTMRGMDFANFNSSNAADNLMLKCLGRGYTFCWTGACGSSALSLVGQ